MGTTITGPDPNQAVWPLIQRPVSGGDHLTRPTGDALTGGTYPAVLADNNDATYVSEHPANAAYRVNVAPFTLPLGARVSQMTANVRGRLRTGNTKWRNIYVGFGDHSSPQSSTPPIKDNVLNGVTLPANSALFKTYTSASNNKNSAGNAVTQDDINKGVFVIFGGNTSYGAAPTATGWDFADVWMTFAYDLAPTANITNPASGAVLSTTPAPVITWDYSDDFQPQAQYQVQVLNHGTATVVYDSGVVTSADTFHAITQALPNGAYDVSVMVWQSWGGPGGVFPALAAATSTFTINFLSFGTPRISAAVIGEHTELTVYPDVNLLTYNGSTSDNNALEWPTQVSCSVSQLPDGTNVRDGSGSLKVTFSATASPQIAMNTLFIPAKAGLTYKAMAYLNPLALSGRKATLVLRFINAANGTVGSVSSAATTLATNSWTQVTVASALAPANTAFLSIGITFSSISVNDVIYVDDKGVWHQAGTAVLPTWSRGGFYEYTPNILSYADSTFESGATAWIADPNTPNSVVAISAAQALDGSNSLALNRSVTGSGDVAAVLGSVPSIPVVPGQSLWASLSSKASVTPRSTDIGFRWYNAAGVFISESNAGWSADSTTTWQNASVFNLLSPFTAPAGAAYAQPKIRAIGVTGTTETHYFDALFVALTNSGAAFYRGVFPATDVAPTLLVEYSDDAGVTWKTLTTIATSSLDDNYVVEDYTQKSATQRSYRCSLSETENGVNLKSPYSATATSTVTLGGVWMHSVGAEASTSYNFIWDGDPRARNDDAKPVMIDVEGLDYGFTQFGTESASSLDVGLHLDNHTDLVAFAAFAKAKSLVCFRDQRGRSYRGIMTSVKKQDAKYGDAGDATFTLQFSGNQP